MAREHPEEVGGPDAVTIIREERDARADHLLEVVRLADERARNAKVPR